MIIFIDVDSVTPSSSNGNGNGNGGKRRGVRVDKVPHEQKLRENTVPTVQEKNRLLVPSMKLDLPFAATVKHATKQEGPLNG